MIRMLLCCFLLFATTGCYYYEITDPTSKKVYYADPMTFGQSGWNGAVRFTDAATGKVVTLQNSEIRSVKKEEAIIGTGGKIRE